MDCSTPSVKVHHQVPELAQTHVHGISDAIQSMESVMLSKHLIICHPLFLLPFTMSHVFISGSQSIGASALPSVLRMNIQD